MTVIDVTDATFADEVLAQTGPVLVEFWAEWCPPCRALGPILKQIDEEHAITVVKINADDNPRLASEFHALALPTMKLFRSGEVVKTIIGAKPKAALLADLEPFLG